MSWKKEFKRKKHKKGLKRSIFEYHNIALGRIEGDPLSGICFVGQYDTQSLQIFLMWPQLGELPYKFKIEANTLKVQSSCWFIFTKTSFF